METAIENAIRSQARQAYAEILDRYAKKITALPPNTFPAKLWLSYYVRQIDKEIRG